MSQPRHRWFSLAMLLWLALTGVAWAAPHAVVEALSAPNDTGVWRTVQETPGALRVRAGVSEVLVAGMELEEGDRVTTDASSRARIKVGTRERIHVSESADLTLGDRTVLQELGQVYYKVRGAFSVQYDRVETAVEGTRFLVGGPAPVEVIVTKGVVAVQQEEGEPYRLRRGDRIVMNQDGATLGVVKARPMTLGTAAGGGLFSPTWLVGEPRLRLGLLGGTNLDGGALSPQVRLMAGLRLGRGLRLVGDAGFSAGASPDGSALRLPGGLGLAWDLGPFSLGGQATVTFEDEELDCGGEALSLHLGASGTLRAVVPLGRNLSLLGVLRGGYAGDFVADLGLGVEVGL